MQLLDKMKAEAERQKNQELELFVLWKRGYCQYLLGDLTQAQETLKQARDKAPKDLRFLNLIYRELGEAYLDAGKVALAEPCLQIVLDCAAGKSDIEKPLRIDEVELVRVHLLKVRCQLGQGKFEAAQKDLAGLELKIAEARKNPAAGEDWAGRFALCQMLLAVLDLRNHNMIGGLKRFEDARKSVQGASAAGNLNLQFDCSLSLASCYWLLARFPEAQRQLDQAEKTLESIATERGLGNLQNAQAGLLIKKTRSRSSPIRPTPAFFEDLDRAGKALHHALDHHGKAVKDQDIFTATANFQLSQVHDLRGRALTAQGQANKAKASSRKANGAATLALDLFHTLLGADNYDALEVRFRRAWSLFRLGELVRARKEAGETLDLFVKNHSKDDLDCGATIISCSIQDCVEPQQAAEHAEAHRRLVANGLVADLAVLDRPEQIQFFRKWDDPGLYASLSLGIHHGGKTKRSAICRPSGSSTARRWSPRRWPRCAAGCAAAKTTASSSMRSSARPIFSTVNRAAIARCCSRNFSGRKRRTRHPTAQWRFSKRQQWCTLADIRKRLSEKEVYVGIFPCA